jgi:hypothetical protein
LARKRSLEPGTAWQVRRGRMRAGNPTGAATLAAPVRSVLLATLILLLAAPAADAAVTVAMAVTPEETTYGDTTKITGTALLDGAPFAGQPVQLEGRRYPFEDEYEVLDTGTTAADGTYAFERELDRNWDLRVRAGDGLSPHQRAYVFPWTKPSYRPRSARVVRLMLRYRVPRDVRLAKPTIFYLGPRGAKRGRRVATGELERIRAGRYRSSAIVRLPAKWNGRFRYGACFRYTGGSGMGNPRAGCPRRLPF